MIKAPTDENCDKMMLNSVQERLEKNKNKVKEMVNDLIEQIKRYEQDKLERLENEAIKE